MTPVTFVLIVAGSADTALEAAEQHDLRGDLLGWLQDPDFDHTRLALQAPKSEAKRIYAALQEWAESTKTEPGALLYAYRPDESRATTEAFTPDKTPRPPH